MSGNKIHKNSDLISVIIPAYNHEKYVGHTIDSLVSQTYSNIELIILNDGSTDNSNEIIKKKLSECKTRFFRVEYSYKENEGIMKMKKEGEQKEEVEML